jgi:hypothetical protein
VSGARVSRSSGRRRVVGDLDLPRRGAVGMPPYQRHIGSADRVVLRLVAIAEADDASARAEAVWRVQQQLIA